MSDPQTGGLSLPPVGGPISVAPVGSSLHRISAEFRGLARAFLARLEPPAILANTAHESARKYITAVQKRRPGKWHREEHLAECIRRWQQQPEAGSLMEPDVHRLKHALALRSLRVVPATSTRFEWDSTELALTITQFGLDVNRGGISSTNGPLAVISHHCLGRRLVRGFGPGDDAAVIADIRRLASHFAHAGICQSLVGQSFSVPGESASWLGTVRRITSQDRGFIILDCRTFT